MVRWTNAIQYCQQRSASAKTNNDQQRIIRWRNFIESCPLSVGLYLYSFQASHILSNVYSSKISHAPFPDCFPLPKKKLFLVKHLPICLLQQKHSLIRQFPDLYPELRSVSIDLGHKTYLQRTGLPEALSLLSPKHTGGTPLSPHWLSKERSAWSAQGKGAAKLPRTEPNQSSSAPKAGAVQQLSNPKPVNRELICQERSHLQDHRFTGSQAHRLTGSQALKFTGS